MDKFCYALFWKGYNGKQINLENEALFCNPQIAIQENTTRSL